MGTAKRTLVFLVTTILWGLFAPAAQAAPAGNDALPIAVLGVKSDDALDQAEALTQAIRTAVMHSQGWSLGEANQALEFLAVKMKCGEPIDAACEARIADVIKADRFLWSVIKFSDSSNKNVVGTLNLFVRGKGTSSTEIRFAATMADPAELAGVAQKALDKVTGGPPQGGIKVATGGVAGQLYIDEKPIGALPAEGGTYQVPAGDHGVTVKAQGFQDASTTVHVQPLATVDALLTMVPVAKEAPVDGRMVGGFVSLGVGVALGGVGLWAALDVNSIRNNDGYKGYRSQLSQSQNACAVAQNGGLAGNGIKAPLGTASDQEVSDLCKRANRDELIEAVTFPLAAVAAGVGGYLLGTSSLGKSKAGDKPSAWMIEPVLGPHQQSLSFRYRF